MTKRLSKYYINIKMKFERLIVFLCIIGLVVVVLFALFAKPQGSFTELYFNEHTELPSLIEYTTPFIASQEGPFLVVPNITEGWEKAWKDEKILSTITSEPLNFADLNKSYNISFTVVSHEARKTKYFYNVTSSMLNETGEFELKPKENITINLTVIPTKAEWKLNSSKSERWYNTLDITNDAWLAGGSEGKTLPLNSIVNPDDLKSIPVSHDVNWFGWILQTRLSFDELAKKPFLKRYEYSKIENALKVYSITDITLSVFGNKLIADINRTEINYISKIQKFEVNLTKMPGTDEEKSQEIHFWYQIRPIGVEED